MFFGGEEAGAPGVPDMPSAPDVPDAPDVPAEEVGWCAAAWRAGL